MMRSMISLFRGLRPLWVCGTAVLLIVGGGSPFDAAAQTSRTLAGDSADRARGSSDEDEDSDGRENGSWRDRGRRRSLEPVTTRPEELTRHLDQYRLENVYDPILAVYRVQALPVIGGGALDLALTGEVSLHWYASGTERALSSLGYTVVENRIRVLPDEALGADRFAVATTASATMRRYPVMVSEQVNGVPLGWPLRLLRASTAEDLATSTPGRRDRPRGAPPAPYTGTWHLAQSSEGYVGYVRDDQVSRTAVYRLPDAVLARPVEAVVDGATYSVPAGAGLLSSASSEGSAWSVPLFGKKTPVNPEPAAVRTGDAGLTSATILALAEPMMKTPYLWGGVTEAGIDCSGFTQFIYRQLGVYLPRDARPQSVVGHISAFGTDVERDARAGDLVYFADETGKITHIGMALGEGLVIHSSGEKGVNVCGYREASRSRPNGMLERVPFSRRVLR